MALTDAFVNCLKSQSMYSRVFQRSEKYASECFNCDLESKQLDLVTKHINAFNQSDKYFTATDNLTNIQENS